MTETLFDREILEAFVLSLPATHIVHQWGDTSVGKVGDKMFVTHGNWDAGNDWQISFKCSELSFEMLPELEHVSPAKYLARAKWVTVKQGADLTQDELRGYITQSHQLVAAKLTRKVRGELGLS